MQDAEPNPDDDSRTASRSWPTRRWIWLVRLSACTALIAYGAVLLQRVQAQRRLPADSSNLQLADLMRFRDWAFDLAFVNVTAGLCFGLFGFLVAVALGPAVQSHGWRSWICRAAMATLPGVGLLFLFSVLETGHLPTTTFSAMMLAGYLLGIWIGRTAWLGPWALLRLLPKLALLALLPLITLAALGALAIDTKPFEFEPLQVTPLGKRQLTDALTKPERLDDGALRLQLSEDEVNLMLAMALAQVQPRARGRIELDTDTVVGELSLPVAPSAPSGRHVNIHTEWRITSKGDSPVVRLERCQVGGLLVPAFLLRTGMSRMQTIAANDTDLRRIQNSLGPFHIEPGGVEVVLASRDAVGDILPSLLARLGRNPNVTSRTRVHYRHLVAEAKGVAREERFTRLVEAAFQLAKERSQADDPVLENRAAILALAILLGHPRLEHLVGPVTDPESRRGARRHARRVTLRGRADWCRHFFVSAALALISNERLTDEAGFFKEEADSAEEGSGFSFSDLLADQAGIRFALAATRNQETARRLQKQLADGFELGALFPEAADLPEGLSDARLESEYGGVGGEKYEAMLTEIERRLNACERLR